MVQTDVVRRLADILCAKKRKTFPSRYKKEKQRYLNKHRKTKSTALVVSVKKYNRGFVILFSNFTRIIS